MEGLVTYNAIRSGDTSPPNREEKNPLSQPVPRNHWHRCVSSGPAIGCAWPLYEEHLASTPCKTLAWRQHAGPRSRPVCLGHCSLVAGEAFMIPFAGAISTRCSTARAEASCSPANARRMQRAVCVVFDPREIKSNSGAGDSYQQGRNSKSCEAPTAGREASAL